MVESLVLVCPAECSSWKPTARTATRRVSSCLDNTHAAGDLFWGRGDVQAGQEAGYD